MNTKGFYFNFKVDVINNEWIDRHNEEANHFRRLEENMKSRIKINSAI